MVHKKGIYEKYIKRPQDFVLSLMALIVLSPVLLITAILVRVKLGSPVIFKQQRPGKDEKIFTLYKFRTMVDERDENGELMPDDVRLTSFGKTLRAISIDELPELINILKGDMAVVGPRPLLVEYLSLYNDTQKRRHLVRPGLTGLAQISGRNHLPWENRFETDVEYVDKISWKFDWIIIFKTVKIVIFRRGISSKHSATMETFAANETEQLKGIRS